jgi:hypothetical protein
MEVSFSQITATRGLLYALDEKGHVWAWECEREDWVRIHGPNIPDKQSHRPLPIEPSPWDDERRHYEK